VREEQLPAESSISVVTKAELRAGVLAAADVETRNRRLTTFDSVAELAVLPISGGVENAWAQMRAYLAASGRRINANDLWIAATAAAYQMPLLTQDGDFTAVNGVAGLTVVEV
jgi:predicted nucleic acid-binding protein